jgi:hypothetical protein
VQFDPLGFAFEHFDQGGRYRAEENGESINATGTLYQQDGSDAFSFDGLTEFANGLADDPEVVDCVSGLLVSYAFGGAGGGTCLAERARKGLREGEYGLVELLARLTAEPHFTERNLLAAASGGATAAAGSSAGPPRDAGASTPEAGVTLDAGTPDGGATQTTGAGMTTTPPLRKDIGITAQYQANNAAPNDNVIGPFLQITNATGTSSVPLESLKVRYYFTNEHAELCPENCRTEGYYAGIHPTGQGAVASRKYVPRGVVKSGAGEKDDAYLEIAFEPGAPQLEPGQSVEVQQYFHTNPYLELDESDDYSFDGTFATFKDQPKITVFQGDALVWGEPPP